MNTNEFITPSLQNWLSKIAIWRFEFSVKSSFPVLISMYSHKLLLAINPILSLVCFCLISQFHSMKRLLSNGSNHLKFGTNRNTKSSQSYSHMSADIQMPSSLDSKLQKVINIRNVVPFSMNHIPNAQIYRSACVSKASKPDVRLVNICFLNSK